MRIIDDNYSLIRILNAVPEGENLDIYINKNTLYKDLEVGEFSPYVYVPNGSYEMSAYIADTKSNPIVRQNIEINNKELTTIAIVGNENNIEVLSIKEDTQPPDGNMSRVRIVHLSPNAPEVNIVADDKIIFEEVGYGDVTEYKEIIPKVYKVDVETYDRKKLLRSDLVKINPGRVYTFYAIGNIPNAQFVQSLDGITFIK